MGVHETPALERNLIVDVGFVLLLVLRFDRQREELRSLFRGLDPAAEPVLGAAAVDAAGIVAIIVLGLLVAFAEQGAAVGVVIAHSHVLLWNWRVKAAPDFRNKPIDLLLVGHDGFPCAGSANNGAIVIAS